ncbi:MAG: cysteine desulfurase [Myxococcota bacterium]
MSHPLAPPYDVTRVRKDFPILQTAMRGHPLVYLDTASSAQKPRCVIDAIAELYSRHYANIHRGLYELSEISTRLHEEAREKVRDLLGAAEAREIVFTRNATEAINLVAASWGRTHVGEGDEVLITALEHHADLVPWQQLCLEKGARLVVAPVDDSGALILEAFEQRLGPRTKLVATTHVSNALGTVTPLEEMVRLAHTRGIPVLVDGAQAVPRFPVDVREIGCDFYAFSGHKLYGPTGIGVLYGRAEILEAMPPYQTGGSMIRSVSFEETSFAEIPLRFEAGTPDIAGAIGLGAAIDYLRGIGLERIERHEAELLAFGTELLEEIPEVRIIGTTPRKTGVISFLVEGVHPHDVGTILDREGVAVRAGHHCAQPLMDRFSVPATVRASLGIYNDREDLERLAAGIHKVVEIFR